MTALPPDWNLMPLGKIAEFRNGVNFTKDSFGHGIKVINVKDFQDYLVPKYDTLDEINPLGVVRAESVLTEGDIVFVRSNGNRELIGRSMFITGLREPVTHSAFTIRTRFTSECAWPRFYAYLFRSSLIREVLSAQGGGTNISNLNQGILEQLVVPVPPLPTQRKIASILSAYDDLIENNTRRIAILDEMARSLYREWFVHFRYPGHEHVPLVDSPLGPVPEGWEVGVIGDLADVVRESINPSAYPDEAFEHYSFPAFDDDAVPSVELGSTIKSGKHAVPEGSVLLAKLNPRIPRVWLPQPSHEMRPIASTEFLVTLPKIGANASLLYAMFRSSEFQEHFAGRSLGTSTSHQRVKPQDFINTLAVVPPPDTTQRFDDVVASMDILANSLRARNVRLRNARDLLLPRLISGDIDTTMR